MNNKPQKERIEELKKSLYSRNKKIRNRSRRNVGAIKDVAYSSWKKKEISQKNKITTYKKKTLSVKLLLGSVLFFIISVAIAFQMFYGGSNIVSSSNIDLRISGPVSVGGGKEVQLQFEIINNNNTDLELADLLIEYPEGFVSSTNSEEKLNRVRYSMGTIKQKQKVEKIVKAIVFGEGGSKKIIKTSLEYRIEGSNAIFVKKGEYILGVSSSPINLSINFLKEVNSGQEVNLKVKVSSNSNNIIKNTMLQIDYPFGFEFIEATPKPFSKNNVWNLGDLPPETERVVNIKGIIKGQDGEEKIFRVYSGPQDNSNERAIGVAYNSIIDSLKIKKPFLSATLSLNGDFSEEYILQNEQRVRGQILWSNNLPTKINDGEIKVKILGPFIDKRSIISDRGFYNSLTNTLTWNKHNYAELGAIEPGGGGRISFSFAHLPLSQKSGEKPEILIELSIKGKRFSEENVPEEIKTSIKKIIKITSDIQLAPRIIYNSGPFVNTGPMPPEVEQETTYTVIWSLVNSSNNLTGVKVKTTLPSYVKWQNVYTPNSEDLIFNKNTGEIVWNVGSVKIGTGLSLPRKEVSFQISLTPSLSQLGTTPILIPRTTLTGRDNFTGTIITNTTRDLSTRLGTDSAFKKGDEIIVNVVK